MQFFEIAVEENPRSEKFWVSYLRALIKARNFQKARQALKNAELVGMIKNMLHTLKRTTNRIFTNV